MCVDVFVCLCVLKSMAATDVVQAELYLEQLSEKHKQLEQQKQQQQLEEQQKKLEEQQKKLEEQQDLEEQRLLEEQERANQAAEESDSAEESMGLMELLQTQLPGKLVCVLYIGIGRRLRVRIEVRRH